MYVEEIVAKRKGKVYKTLLVRESYRAGTAVKHRTIANISHLPQGCIEEIKRYLKGSSGTRGFSDVQVIDSREYGASQSALLIARKLALDKMIYSRKAKWREDALALIVGRLLYPGNEASLTNLFADTVLWECCGHEPKTLPEVDDCYSSLAELLSRQAIIQKKITDQHLDKGAVALLFLTHTIVEEEREYCEFPSFRCDNASRQRYKEYITLLLSNVEGCPLAVKTFPVTLNGLCIIHEQIKEITSQLTNECVVLIGDQEVLNKVYAEDFSTIAALTQAQINDLVKRKIILAELFSGDHVHEVLDPANPSMRYVLFLNLERKSEQLRVRNELIKKSAELLLKLQRKPKTVVSEVEKIWMTLRTEKFFKWHLEDGRLHFSINEAEILQEEQ